MCMTAGCPFSGDSKHCNFFFRRSCVGLSKKPRNQVGTEIRLTAQTATATGYSTIHAARTGQSEQEEQVRFKRFPTRQRREGRPFRRGRCGSSATTSSDGESGGRPRRPKWRLYCARHIVSWVVENGDRMVVLKRLPSAPVPLVLASLIALRRLLTGIITANVKGTLAIAEAAATARTACSRRRSVCMSNHTVRASVRAAFSERRRCRMFGKGNLPCGDDRSSSRGGSLPGRGSRTMRTRARRSCSGGASSSRRPHASKSSRRGPVKKSPLHQ